MITPLWFTFACLLLGQFNAFFYILAIGGLLDSYARYKEYKRHLINLRRDHTHYRALCLRYRRSYCQREALLMAANRIDRELCQKVRKEFYNKGYKWYHIIPDGFFTPKVLFSLRFWKATLGIK